MSKGHRHAVVTRNPVLLNGHVVGEALVVEYRDGAPLFGKCYALDCHATAVAETLLGLQFCDNCYGKFYSDDDTFRFESPEVPDKEAQS